MDSSVLLLVDDRQDNVFVMEQLVNEYIADCEVLTAQSAEKGLSIAAETHPDVILVNVQMPGMDGIEMCRRLKAGKATSHVPVLLLTAHETTAERKAKGLEVGADDFLSKPIDNVELIARIKVLLRIKKAEDLLRKEKDLLEDLVQERTKGLRESEKERRLQSEIAANMYEGVYLIRVGDGVILYTNPRFEEMFGYDPDEMVGKHVSIVNAPTEMTPEETEHHIVEILKQSGFWKGEIQNIKKDGTPFWCYASATLFEHPEYGEIIVAVHTDIDKRKRAEEGLRESEVRFRSTFEQAAVGIVHVTPDGHFIKVNQRFCDIVGYTQEEMIARSFKEITYPDDLEGDLRQVEQLLADTIPTFSIEKRYVRKDGTVTWVNLTVSLVRDPSREPKYFIGVVEDINERKKAEEEKAGLEAQLQQSQKMEAVGTLAGGIAHDFNNILTPLMIRTEMAQLETPDETPVKRYLDEIFKASDRARELVRQILIFCRQSNQERMPLKISVIVKEALKLLRASLPSTIEIHQKIEGHSGKILADPTQIHQVLMNLCTNAGHAMREKGGVLEVNLRDEYLDSEGVAGIHDLSPGPYFRLTVRDTGHGIDKTVMERIFDPYFTTKEKGEGTGMGLSVVHGIVTSYGGAITVDSQPGKGCTFEVFFPKIETWTPAETENAGPLPTGTERILFVDDEEVMVETTKGMLEHLGYKVVARTSSIETLEVFRNYPERFDLVITDMTMPKMTGDELARELLKIRPDMPIILCTGFNEKIDEEKAKEVGIREFVMKPTVMREMAMTIRNVLDEK